jgi:hypothetical protein
MGMFEPEYHEALRACQEGRFTEELRLLYQMPLREQVPWDLFPNWARPSDPVEGGHEGGSM